MKSDQEFLKGIYEKANEMQRSQQEARPQVRYAKRKTAYLRFGAAAAILLLFSVSGVFLQDWWKGTEKIEPQSPGIASLRMETVNIQQLLEQATDIVEVAPSRNEGEALEILRVYKISSEEQTVSAILESKAAELGLDQKALVFLQIDKDTFMVLGTLTEDEKEGTFTGPFQETITREELEAYFAP